jgi:hypothetical protein
VQWNPTLQILAALLLAIGPQIYVDGLVVIDKGRGKEEPVGRISSKQIISKILNLGYLEWLDLKASQIMDRFVGNGFTLECGIRNL